MLSPKGRMWCHGVVWTVASLALLASIPAHAELNQDEKEQGFVSLFDGKSFDGWQGGKDIYAIENGCLVCVGGKASGTKNLYTTKEYRDFILRFEFRLTDGANNGIGLRCPLKGEGAFAGMEIQVLDDSADIYRDIKPWQRHGSVYGVVAAKPGHLKPVGEWNSEEITLVGRRIKVVLNGHTIVDADLDEASAEGTLDNRPHPGLSRETGYIALLGHDPKPAFRNLRIKDLTPASRSAAGQGDNLGK